LSHDVAAPLFPVRGGILVGCEAFDGHPEIRPKRSFGRIEARKKFTLKRGGEKSLG
jgi:hypothetical protein